VVVYGLGWGLSEAGYGLGNRVSVSCCVSLVSRHRQQLSVTPSKQRVFFFIGQFLYICVCIQVSYVLPLFVCFVNNVNNVLAIGNSRIATKNRPGENKRLLIRATNRTQPRF
jgi:hypothetical protein